MKNNYTFLLALAFALIGTINPVYAQKQIHKPVTRHIAYEYLTLNDITQIYKLINLPAADKFLAARNWEFFHSIHEDSDDHIIYVRINKATRFREELDIFLCNGRLNSKCAKPGFHNGNQKQHIETVLYEVPKSIFTKLKVELEASTEATGHRTNENQLAIIYSNNKTRFEFITNSDSQSSYIINYTDEPLHK